MTPSITLLVLRCNDIQVSKAFYERFGFTFIKEQHGKGPVHYSTQTNGIVLELYPGNPTEKTDNIRLGFSCASLAQLESVDKHPIPVNDFQSENNTHIIVVTDPDGRRIELIQTKED